MPAHRCSHCDIDYPNDKEHCLVCGRPTWEHNGRHDRGWREQVAALNRRPKLGALIPNAQVDIIHKDGELFVADELMQKAGYTELESGSIVMVRSRYYEVFGAVSGPDIKGWWIKLVKTLNPDFPYPVMTRHQYQELETQRGLRL